MSGSSGEMGNLLAQALKLQRAEDDARAALQKETVRGSAEGGRVVVELNGLGAVQKVTIRDEVMTAGREALEALILAALQDGAGKAEHLAEESLSKVRGGLHLPRMK